MSSLRSLQSRFVADLFSADEDRAYEYLRDDGLSAAQRLAIYRGNVFGNYRDALRAVYPVVLRLVGERFFARLADAYVRRHPSLVGDLNRYGAELADFLAAFAPAQSLVYLADVARLEWLMDEAFHAADPPQFDLARLATLPAGRQGGIRFRLHPACRLFKSAYPVRRIWQVNQPDWQGDIAVDLAEGGDRMLVHRIGFEVTLRPLAPGDFVMLAHIAGGLSFADAYAAASEAPADFNVGAFLREQIGAGVLVDFDVDDAPPAGKEPALQKL